MSARGFFNTTSSGAVNSTHAALFAGAVLFAGLNAAFAAAFAGNLGLRKTKAASRVSSWFGSNYSSDSRSRRRRAG